ncbi:hypothetical protein WDW89_21600 [Deltaproteobacteria bacterium TL4]
MNHFSIEILPDGLCKLAGKISEYTDLSSVVNQVVNLVIFDLKGVTAINSVGLKVWVKMLTELRNKGISIEYQNCSEKFMLQFMLNPVLTHHIKIHSFYITFVCDSCLHETQHLLHREEIDLTRLPTIPCPECGETMSLAEEEELDFLEWQ